MIVNLGSLWRRGKAGEDGSPAVEFALVFPILIILVLGGADFGIMAYNIAQVAASARAGAEFASTAGNAVNGTTIPASLQPVGGFKQGPTASFSPVTIVCTCFDPNAKTFTPSMPTHAACSNACNSPHVPIGYAQANLQVSGYTPFLADFFGNWPFGTLHGQATLRVP